MPTLFRLLAALTVVLETAVALADLAPDTNVRLSDYLESLNDDGQHIIFSSDLVSDELRLEHQPPAEMSASVLLNCCDRLG